MPQLMLASVNSTPDRALSAQWVHDIRNALAITGLHLETLERLSGPSGRKAANAAQAVMRRVAGMCNASLSEAARPNNVAQRLGFDLMQTINDVATILAPIVPEGFEIRVPKELHCVVLANPGEVYRIIFNLVQNAILVARDGSSMSHVGVSVTRNESTVAIRIFDDGPGLPEAIRSNIFRLSNASTTGGSGQGIAIARELAERNGGRLRLCATQKGTGYVLELTHFRAVAREENRA